MWLAVKIHSLLLFTLKLLAVFHNGSAVFMGGGGVGLLNIIIFKLYKSVMPNFTKTSDQIKIFIGVLFVPNIIGNFKCHIYSNITRFLTKY